MCKKHPDSDTVITTPAPTPSLGYCPHAYYQFRDKCYKIGPGNLVTWDDALDLCSSLHPDNMISIMDDKEQGTFWTLYDNRSYCFDILDYYI